MVSTVSDTGSSCCSNACVSVSSRNSRSASHDSLPGRLSRMLRNISASALCHWMLLTTYSDDLVGGPERFRCVSKHVATFLMLSRASVSFSGVGGMARRVNRSMYVMARAVCNPSQNPTTPGWTPLVLTILQNVRHYYDPRNSKKK